ncbi:MAG: FadR/GntR family transcriptional regulator [Alphaproteobacteria bacterium]|nr:FadR/GntR family transcriptional regulator [Alphaproteobacteria bacterium]
MIDKRPPANLAEQVTAHLSADIRSGRLQPGDRLPTEQELTSAWKVSRTVVREAVAGLRADGLVITRRGSGAYVAPNPTASPFRIPARRQPSIGEVLEVMELRLAVEVEAAALAAERATRRQVAGIRTALRAIDRALKGGDGAVAEDFAFHRAISEATGNSQFPRFLAFLGSHVIPRQSVRLSVDTPAERRRYLERIQHEHGRIVTGIAGGDGAEARRAMHAHLTRSLERYRKLAEGKNNG